MAKKTDIDRLGWPVVLILTLFFGWLVQGINRMLRGRVIIGILWIITGGVCGIGWFIDFICVLLYKDIKIFA
jgi:TM2 domain-containing membrane protein YozV